MTTQPVDDVPAAFAPAPVPVTVEQQRAQLIALEAAVVAAATATLADRLAGIASTLRAAFVTSALAAPAVWLLARRRAATALTGTRVDVAAAVERFLPRAVDLGARHAGATGPVPGFDPRSDSLVRDGLADLNNTVRSKLRRAAELLVREPVTTDAQLRDVEDRIDVARRTAAGMTGDIVTRAAAASAGAAADELGISLMWIAEPGACDACLGTAGSIREPQGTFASTGRPLPWANAVADGPPGHPHCRCWLIPADPAVSERLGRELARYAASGAQVGLSGRLNALNQLLLGRTALPTVDERRRNRISLARRRVGPLLERTARGRTGR